MSLAKRPRFGQPGPLYALALVGSLVLSAVIGAQGVPADTRAHASGERETLLVVTHEEIPSKVFHVTRDVSIWVPEESGQGVRYPVLVFPDAEEKVQFRSALANIQFLINRRLIPPLIVVGLPYHASRRHELSPPATGATAKAYPMAGGADSTMQFIADELLPWVDARYPTQPLHILAGHSLGALFAMYAMSTRPDVFRIVIAMSPVLTWNDGMLANQVATGLISDTRHPRTLFLTSGGLEPSIDEPMTAFATRFSAMLDSAHATHLRFERRRYARDVHEMTPLDGLIDGLRMAFDPIVVPIDSAVADLAARHVEDATTIQLAGDSLKARYAHGVASLGLATPFPEAPLDMLAGYALQANHSDLAVTMLRENLAHYPHSSNAHESLGEGLAATGDTASAAGEFRTAIEIARVELAKPTSILVRAQERGVMSAAEAQLEAMHKRE
jgi:predicted alpha/beta superfamily hydrolase